MAKSTILVSLGSGADDPATSGKISVRRVREGADGDMLVLTAWKDYSVTEGLQLDVTVGELYESRELEPRGRTRYWYAPATTTTYADLEDVFPLPPGEDYGPQGVGVVDAIQPEAGKVAFNLTDGSTTTPIDLPPGEPGPNSIPTDTFMASKADDPTSEFAASLSAKIRALLPDGFTYNSDGTIATSTEGGVTTEYTWNADGSIHSETRDGKTKTYTYDGSGRLTGSAVA